VKAVKRLRVLLLHLGVHRAHSSPLWCDIPSKAVCFVIVDDADRLHPGVDDDGSHELETALPHGI
jgi:hypothetical protein